MQDRFKYRAINMQTKEITYIDSFYWFEENGVSEIDHNNTGSGSFAEYWITQCTGLKDKNGKLIYEGDIFKTQEFCRGKEYYCYSVIKYSDGGYYLEGSYVTSGNTIRFINYDIRNISKDLLESGLFDLVGNIYENPELLEVSNDH
jgi:uncharacterized phage protein (TIGR01671 family)